MSVIRGSKQDLIVFVILTYLVSTVEAQMLSCTTEILVAVFVLLASILLIGIIAFVIWYCCCREKGKQSSNDIEVHDGKEIAVVDTNGTVHCPFCERQFALRTSGNNDIGISNPTFGPGTREVAVDVPNNNINSRGGINGPDGSGQKIPYIVGPKTDTHVNRGEDGSLGLMIAHEKTFPLPSMFVRDVVPNGSAAKAGVLEYGDEIVAINGKSIEGMSHKESKSLLHAEPGDTKPVKLTIVKNSLETKAQMRANMPSVDVNRPGTSSRDTVIDMPEGDFSGSAPKGRVKGGGLNCCGSPKTKGESDYGYELEPVGKTRKLEISGKSGGDVGIHGPKSHVVNMGGMSNDGFDAPDANISGGSGDVNIQGPRMGGASGGVSGPNVDVPYIVGPVVDTSIRKGDNGSLDVLIAKEPDFPSPAMFIRKVYNPSSNKVSIQPGDEIVKINGELIKGKSYEDSMNILRKAPGKKIKIGVVKNSHNIKGNMKYNKDGASPPHLSVAQPKTKSGASCCGSPKTQGEMNYAYETGSPHPKGEISGQGNVDGRGIDYSGPNAPKKKKGGKLNCCGSPKTTDDMDMDYRVPAARGSLGAGSLEGDVNVPDIEVHDPGLKRPKGKLSGPKGPSLASDIDGPEVNLGGSKFKGPEKDIALRSGFDGPSFDGDIDGANVNIKGPGFKGPEGNLSGKGGLNGPDFNGDIDGPDVNVKGPGFKGPEGNLSGKGGLNGPDFDGDIDGPDINIKGSGIKGPGLKGPKGNLSGKGGLNVPDFDGDIDGSDVNIKGPGFKGPKGNLSGKGGLDGPDFDGDIDGPDVDIKGPGFKGPKGNLSGKGGLNRPDFEGPSFSGDVSGPEVNVGGPGFRGPQGPNIDAGMKSPDINGPSITGPKKPKLKGPKLKCCGSTKGMDDSDGEYELPSGSAGLKGPKGKAGIDGPDLHATGPSQDGDLDTPDVKFKGPGFEGPKGNISAKGGLDGPDVNLKHPKGKVSGKRPDVDIDGPSLNGTKKVKGKKPKIKWCGSKTGANDSDGEYELPSGSTGFKVDGPEIDTRGPSVDVDIDRPDMSIQGPDLKGPRGRKGLEGPDLDLTGPDLDLSGPDLDLKGSDFDMSGPKGPSFGFKKPGFKGPEIDKPNFSGDIKGPKIKANKPGFDGDIDGPDLTVNGPDIDGPDFDANLDGPDGKVNKPGFKGPSWKFKKPDLSLPDWKLKKTGFKGPDFDGPSTDGNFDGPDVKLKEPDIDGPDIEGPSFGGDIDGPDLKVKGPNIEGPDMEGPDFDADVEGPDGKVKKPGFKGPNWKFNMPDINMPDWKFKKPGFKGPKGQETSIDGDFDGPDVNVKKPDIDGPDIEGPSFGGDIDGPDLKVKGPNIEGPDMEGPDFDADVEGPDGKVKKPGFKGPNWKFNMPDINMPDWKFKKPGFKGPKGQGPSIDGDFDGPDVNVKKPDIEGPDIEGPSFGGDIDGPDVKVKGPNINEQDFDGPYFEGDIDGPDGKVETKGFKGPSWKFKKPDLSLPDWKLKKPGFKGPDLEGPSFKGDIDGPDVKVKKPGFGGPEFEGPSFGGDIDSADVKVKGPQIEGPDMEGPDFDADIEGPDGKVKKPGFKGPNWKFNMPDINMPDWKLKKPGFKGPKAEGPSIDGDFDGPDVNVKKPGFDGPDIEGPSFGGVIDGPDVKIKGPNIEGPDMEGPDFDADIEGPDEKVKKPGFKGPGWKFKKPDLSLPDWKLKKPGFKGPDFNEPSLKGNVSGPDVDGPDVKGLSVQRNLEGPHFDGPSIEGYAEGDIGGDIGFGTPDIKGPSFGGKFGGPELDLDVNTPDFSTPKSNIDVDLPEFDSSGPSFEGNFNMQGGDVKASNFGMPKGKFDLMGEMPNFGDDIVEEVDAGVVEASLDPAIDDNDLVLSEDEHGNLVYSKPKVKTPTAKVVGIRETPVRWSASLERKQATDFELDASAKKSQESSSSSSSEDEEDKSGEKSKGAKSRTRRKDKKSSSSSSSSSEDEDESKSKGFKFGIKLPGMKKKERRSSSSSSSSSSSPESYDLVSEEKGTLKEHTKSGSSSSSESDSERPSSLKITPEIEKIKIAENAELESQPDFPSIEPEQEALSPTSPVMKLQSSSAIPNLNDGSVSVKLVPDSDGQLSMNRKNPTSPTYRVPNSPGSESKLWDIVQGYIDTDNVINDDGSAVEPKTKEEPAIPTYISSLERSPKISREERREKTKSLPTRVSPRNFSVEIDENVDDPWARHYLGDRRSTESSLSRPESRTKGRPSSGDRTSISPSVVFSKVPHVKGPFSETGRDPYTRLGTSSRGEQNPEEKRRSLKELEGSPTKRLHDDMFQLSKEKPKPVEREKQRDSRKYLWDLGPSDQSRAQVGTKPRSRSSPPAANRGAMSPVKVDISADTKRDEYRVRPITSRRSYELSKSQPSLSVTTGEKTSQMHKQLMDQQQKELKRREDFMKSGKGEDEPKRLTLRERKAIFEKENF